MKIFKLMAKFIYMQNYLSLFPHIEPYATGFITEGCHEIYYEECGNPVVNQ